MPTKYVARSLVLSSAATVSVTVTTMVAAVAVSAEIRIRAALGGRPPLFVADDFQGQVNDGLEVAVEVVELHLGGVEGHQEQNQGHDLEHLEDSDGGFFLGCYARCGPRLEDRLEGFRPGVEVLLEAEAVALEIWW